MRPVIRALFVLSFFGVLAMHVSTGLLREYLEPYAAWLVNLIDLFLRTMMIMPLGRSATIYGLWGVGAALSLAVFIMTPATKSGTQERHSTW